MKISRIILFVGFTSLVASSCNLAGHQGLFAKKTDREKYESKLAKDSGKDNAFVKNWLQAGESSLLHPLAVPLPYREQGKFYTADASASAFRVFIKRGQRLSVQITSINTVYMDAWQAADSAAGTKPAYLESSDTANNKLEIIAEKDMNIVLRFQPQLQATDDYQFSARVDPSFVFPLAQNVKANIGSFWGADRDKGIRKHEGVDIFAPARSAAVAVSNGTITSVSENTLGGKVIFLQPDNTAYNVYYAHLDEQLVQAGQRVTAGETIGLTGNTGSAKYTPSHLHFGIYTTGGAINPLAFIEKTPAIPEVSIPKLPGNEMITNKAARFFSDLTAPEAATSLPKNARVSVEATNGSYYRVSLPDGRKGFVPAKELKAMAPAVKGQ